MSDLEKRTLTIERILPAPIDLVWEAWTRPEHIANWWGPPGMKLDIIEHEFKVGGKWKYSMTMPDGKEFVTDRIYSDIVKNEKIILCYSKFTTFAHPFAQVVELVDTPA